MPRSRSRSPYRSPHQPSQRRTRQRSRSPSPHASKHSRRSQDRQYSDKRKETYHTHSEPQASKALPFDATQLTKHDLSAYRSMFGLYLDIQKGLDVEELPKDEVKGRWKSFVKKWNAGDLAQGWYDPETFEKATRGTFGQQGATRAQSDYQSATPDRDRTEKIYKDNPRLDEDAEWDDLDEYGPRLPASMLNEFSRDDNASGRKARSGPSIPLMSDIRMRDELEAEDTSLQRDLQHSSIRDSRKVDRKIQRERLDELVPRAEAGSRERQMEKKRDIAASNRAFATAKDAGGDVELKDADILGDEDSLRDLKRMKDNEQRKKNERELRREEIVRARTAEREERLKGMREKEAKTMEMLKALAKARFGENG